MSKQPEKPLGEASGLTMTVVLVAIVIGGFWLFGKIGSLVALGVRAGMILIVVLVVFSLVKQRFGGSKKAP